jgi:hypothetical protein
MPLSWGTQFPLSLSLSFPCMLAAAYLEHLVMQIDEPELTFDETAQLVQVARLGDMSWLALEAIVRCSAIVDIAALVETAFASETFSARSNRSIQVHMNIRIDTSHICYPLIDCT